MLLKAKKGGEKKVSLLMQMLLGHEISIKLMPQYDKPTSRPTSKLYAINKLHLSLKILIYKTF